MSRRLVPLSLVGFVFVAGCFGAPNKNEIQLRKDKQALQKQVEELTAKVDQLSAQVRGYESDRPTVETLPQERLDQMWTTAGIRFGRLTGIDRGAEGRPLKVYLQPFDEDGATIKAAGDIVVGVYNLDGENIKLGEWTFDAADSKSRWSAGGFLNEYVLTCPWEGDAPEAGTKLLLRTQFTDALTGRPFEAKQDLSVE